MSVWQDLERLMARRATETGLISAAGATPETFQRTLSPRSNLDQALVSGLTFVVHQGIVSTLQEAIQDVAWREVGDQTDPARWSRTTMAADLVAVGVGMALQEALRHGEERTVAKAAGRSTGWFLTTTGISGLVAGAVQEWADRAPGSTERSRRLGVVTSAAVFAAAAEFERRRRERRYEDIAFEESEISAARSVLLGTGVALGATTLGRLEGWLSGRVAGLLAKVLPGEEKSWRAVGHLAALGAFGLGGRAIAQLIFRRIEGGQLGFEAGLDVPPLEESVSGSTHSLIPYPSMAKMGRRMVWTLRLPAEIERVMGRPAHATPVRIYGGLRLADSPEERARIVLDDLERAGGLERSWLMVVSPTGTGYANYAASGALEYLTLGDCATVAAQYSARPSFMSLDHVDEGREQFRVLIDALGKRLRERHRRPRILVFGESLGAWTSQDAFLHQGTAGLVDAGIDRALWVGTPYESKWRDQVLGDRRGDVDRSLVGVYSDIGHWESSDRRRRQEVRFVLLDHHDDAVTRFGGSLLIRKPDWLGHPERRPPGVPRSQRWYPLTTFVQTLIDMKNAARVRPGLFTSTGHDYRADIPHFIAALVDADVNEEQLDRITLALEAEEALRVGWLDRHGMIGSGMANELLSRIRQLDPAVYQAAFQELAAERLDMVTDWEQRRRAGGQPLPGTGV